MRSSRNTVAKHPWRFDSLIDWKMRSSRNYKSARVHTTQSLIDWKMRSSRNPAVCLIALIGV